MNKMKATNLGSRGSVNKLTLSDSMLTYNTSSYALLLVNRNLLLLILRPGCDFPATSLHISFEIIPQFGVAPSKLFDNLVLLRQLWP